MMSITLDLTGEMMLFYISVLATIGVVLKMYQLFGRPNK